jgi:hypothetical protein
MSGLDKCKCGKQHSADSPQNVPDRAAIEMQESLRKNDELYFQMTELLRKIEMGHEVDEQDLPEDLRPGFRRALQDGSLHRMLVSCT